jgi:hypothetical protein
MLLLARRRRSDRVSTNHPAERSDAEDGAAIPNPQKTSELQNIDFLPSSRSTMTMRAENDQRGTRSRPA